MSDVIAEVRVSHSVSLDALDPSSGALGAFSVHASIKPRALTITIPLDASQQPGEVVEHHAGWIAIPADSPIAALVADVIGGADNG